MSNFSPARPVKERHAIVSQVRVFECVDLVTGTKHGLYGRAIPAEVKLQGNGIKKRLIISSEVKKIMCKPYHRAPKSLLEAWVESRRKLRGSWS